eukprot:maker-scaffold662_size116868-snap-gene-0.16 protein:Tk03147 transcript:maker-scaffold662_size116868-snap-gene-0.16-mRNA-1 annotation:"achain thyroid hormone beta dna binding domain homodimer with inverted palindrome tre"
MFGEELILVHGAKGRGEIEAKDPNNVATLAPANPLSLGRGQFSRRRPMWPKAKPCVRECLHFGQMTFKVRFPNDLKHLRDGREDEDGAALPPIGKLRKRMPERYRGLDPPYPSVGQPWGRNQVGRLAGKCSFFVHTRPPSEDMNSSEEEDERPTDEMDVIPSEDSNSAQSATFTVCPICQCCFNDKHCFHYGGVSCYSCRAFFRRAHQGTKEPNFKCKRESRCDITEKTRRKCQKCRYDLCLKSGMDPSLVLDDDQKKVRFRNFLKKKLVVKEPVQPRPSPYELPQKRFLGKPHSFPQFGYVILEGRNSQKDSSVMIQAPGRAPESTSVSTERVEPCPSSDPPERPTYPARASPSEMLSTVAIAPSCSQILEAKSEEPLIPSRDFPTVPSTSRGFNATHEVPLRLVPVGSSRCNETLLDVGPPRESKDDLMDSIQQVYCLAMAQINISPQFIQDLVDFHSLESSNLTKWDLGEHIFRIGTHFKQFAQNLPCFRALCKADQLTLLERNTPLFVLYILAQYFGASSGEEQLQWLLDVNMPQNYSNSQPNYVGFETFNERLRIFNPEITAACEFGKGDFAHSAKVMSEAGITLRYSGMVANVILFSTNVASTVVNSTRIQAEFIKGLDLLSHAHHQIEATIEVEVILKMIKTLEHCQTFFNTYADWQTECGSDACPNLPFINLKLPYTKEEETWVENQVSWFTEAFVAIPIQKEFIQDFFSYTLLGVVPPRIVIQCYYFFSDRMHRSLHLHPEFTELSIEEQSKLWQRNSIDAMAICFARLEACDHGYGQAKILFGTQGPDNFLQRRFMNIALPHLIRKYTVKQVNKSVPILLAHEVDEYQEVVQRMKRVLQDDVAFKLILMITLFQGVESSSQCPVSKKRDAYVKFLERRIRQMGLLGVLKEELHAEADGLIGIKVIMETIGRMKPLIQKFEDTVIRLTTMMDKIREKVVELLEAGDKPTDIAKWFGIARSTV